MIDFKRYYKNLASASRHFLRCLAGHDERIVSVPPDLMTDALVRYRHGRCKYDFLKQTAIGDEVPVPSVLIKNQRAARHARDAMQLRYGLKFAILSHSIKRVA